MADNQVIWISHRGYCKDAVENTRRSFDAAIALGFRHLETDLRTSADGQIFLQHNSSLDFTCGLSRSVERSSAAELKSIKTRDGQELMTLEALFENYKDYFWTLDVKGPADRHTLDILKAWALKNNAMDWLKEKTRFLLWSPSTERHAQKLFPGVLTLAQEKECLRAGLSVLSRLSRFGSIKKGRTYSVPPFFGKIPLFTKSTLAAYHARGARLLAYLPEDDRDVKKAYFLGFDEILTNGRKLF